MLYVKTPAAPNSPIKESINTADINSSLTYSKQVRFVSPCNIPSLGLCILLYSSKGDGNHCITDPDNNDSDKLQYSITLLEKQKISPKSIETTLDKHKGHSASVISDINSVVSL